MFDAVSPAEWGAEVDYDSWNRPNQVDKWVLHYGGGAVSGADDGVAREMAVLRAWEYHHINARGWTGIAYNYAIGQSGTLYRLRGENDGGHTRGDYEPDGISENEEARAVVFILGGSQQPSDLALKTFRRMWAQDPMPVIGHREVFLHGSGGTDTQCPGEPLTEFINTKGYENMALTDKGQKWGVDDWFKDAWAAAKIKGWVSDETDPDDVVTKEEFMALALRIFQDLQSSAVDTVARTAAAAADRKARAARTVANRATNRLNAIAEAAQE